MGRIDRIFFLFYPVYPVYPYFYRVMNMGRQDGQDFFFFYPVYPVYPRFYRVMNMDGQDGQDFFSFFILHILFIYVFIGLRTWIGKMDRIFFLFLSCISCLSMFL